VRTDRLLLAGVQPESSRYQHNLAPVRSHRSLSLRPQPHSPRINDRARSIERAGHLRRARHTADRGERGLEACQSGVSEVWGLGSGGSGIWD
jgi:hypothetical protein